MKKRRLRLKPLLPIAKRVGRFLFKSQVLTIFLVLCALGVWVGAETRPSPNVVPWGELFDHMSVVSYRESPADTMARFVVELEAGGKVFSQYDVDSRRFLPPASGREYSRSITGTHYRPIRVRGHVAHGFWLDVPDSAGHSLLPEQFDELYRTTLGLVKPVGVVTNVLGILSGYSVGYRLATWGGTLGSRAVQARVLATPDLGRTLAREAWRRVLLEPVIMFDEDDVTKFAAIHGTHRLYANFFRLALDDSDGFIPREAARLAALGRTDVAHTMLAFAGAVQRASRDSVDLGSADFDAVERWASLLDRRGHWASGAIPPAGEERASYLGTLAWYGLAPPSATVDRVWVGPRLLVKTGEAEGFVADDITSSRTGCPITWRPRMREENSNAAANASAWFSDRPEFPALVILGRRVASGVASASRQIAANLARRGAEPHSAIVRAVAATASEPGVTAVTSPPARPVVTPAPAVEEAPRRAIDCPMGAGVDAGLIVVATDSAAIAADARAVRTVFERADSAPAGPATAAGALDAATDTLRVRGVHDALLHLSGTVAVLGSPPHTRSWGIGLRDPRGRPLGYARIGLLDGQAASSSGRDATTDGAPVIADSSATPPAGNLISVTVLARRATDAEAWSAQLLALDPAEARRRASERADLAAVLVERGGDGVDTVWVESDLKDRFELEAEASSRFRVVYF